MSLKPKAVARPENAPALTPQEAQLVGSTMVTRKPSIWGRFVQGVKLATGIVTRDDFERYSNIIAKELNGQSIGSWEAAKKATRLIRAYTQAHGGAEVAKCEYSDTAILIVFLGDRQSGFLFQRGITLKDPKGVKRG